MNNELFPWPVFYLMPGELRVTDGPGMVTTVLGSCVSVTMFNPRLGIGAICHGLLPRWREAPGKNRDDKEGFKYVDYSIRFMLSTFRYLGVRPQEIEVKLFGGADMFARTTALTSVGRQNVATALEVIERERLTISNSDTGGSQGRKINFLSHTGDVFLKRLGAAYG